MAIQQRRTTFYEWSCDGPECLAVERIFDRSERPAGWLTLQVTRDTKRVFHDAQCAQRYFTTNLDDGLDKAAEEAEAAMYGANA